MNVLVTGGAGYIGSHLTRVLADAGHTCVVYDNFVSGHPQAVGSAKLVTGDLCDTPALAKALADNRIDAVINMASYIEAGESVEKPGKYFQNNTFGGLSLLEAMRTSGVGRLVFSSTAAVYGTPQRVPIEETDRTEPINPYGASKLCVEYMMQAYAAAHGIGFVALRYFNVAGAHPNAQIGEAHKSETHLIPLVLQVPMGQRKSIKIFGDDYDTPDGTCVRDYIHVMDLAAAHVLAIDAIEPGKMKVYNLGNGAGFSVKQIIQTCRDVTGHAIPSELAPRRPGDPPSLVAACQKAQAELGWKQQYADIQTIVRHAWAWHKDHPNGYAAAK